MKLIHVGFHRFTISLVGVVFVGLMLGVSPTKLVAQPVTGITTSGKVVAIDLNDIIQRGPIEYPYNDRRNYHQGKGLYRVSLDAKTGLVRNVIVIRSTGWATLDDTAVSGLRQLRMKPGKWKQIDFPVTYEMARSREEAMEKMRRRQANEPLPIRRSQHR